MSQVSTSNIVPAKEWIAQGSYFTTKAGPKIFYHREGQGRLLLLLHGFPTWSYDYAEMTPLLRDTFDMIALDFISYGASDKPTDRYNTVAESADQVEELLAHLKIKEVTLVIHDYGGIVGQELVERQNNKQLPFKVNAVHILNSGIMYNVYRPTVLQRLLKIPILGWLIASQITKERSKPKINAILGKKKLTDAEFDDLWYGISLKDGHKLAYLQIRYNTERGLHHQRWIDALSDYDGPIQMIWGLEDPVSGKHVLDAARKVVPKAKVIELPDVGHWPQFEAPEVVAKAIREF